MEQEQYEKLVTRQAQHWWHMARREILGGVLERYLEPGSESEIIEIGAGCGGNVPLLSRYGPVTAVEMDEGARDYMAATLEDVTLKGGALPDPTMFGGRSFDVAIMFDVLEHVKEEAASLEVIRQHVRPGGLIFVSVPAYNWLWCAHDDRVHHQRRYTRAMLRGALEGAGWSVEQVGHFNNRLFPLAVAARMKDKVTGAKMSTGFEVPSKRTNDLFYKVFRGEAEKVVRGGYSYGLSIVAVARNPEGLAEGAARGAAASVAAG